MSVCDALGLRTGSTNMHMLHTFLQWIGRSSDKTEKLAFKNQREAAAFVRRVYNENGAPNAELKKLYRRGVDIRNAQAR